VAVMATLDKRAVFEGAALALAVTLPPVVLVRILHGDDMQGEESNLWFIAVLAVFAGFTLGGHRAAKRRPREGYSNAAAASALAFVLILVYSVLRRGLSGDDLGLTFAVSMALLGSITVSLGVLGGWIAVRMAQRRSQ